MKKYRAIFFDWDGTAVLSRRAPVDEAVFRMRPLLDQGVKLAIISGTTYENIASGELHKHFTPAQLQNLFLGLGRGAFEYGFSVNGEPIVLTHRIPETDDILRIHDTCYQIHRKLLEQYDIDTDIIFSRPNYCKIDLMPNKSRGERMFLQEDEPILLQKMLAEHGVQGGIEELINMAESYGEKTIPLKATSDAKFLEVGPTGKSNNADALFSLFAEKYSMMPKECCFWGDEFVGIVDGVYGSDSGMITQRTERCDFYDVSDLGGKRPANVIHVGGGVSSFMSFLHHQLCCSE